MIDVKVEVKGLRELQKKSEQTVRDLRGEPMLKAMRDATLIVTRGAKINAPVDTGRLRASITPEVRSEGEDMLGVVGSNVIYAPYQELGTKYMPGKFYLQRAFDAAKPRIMALFDKALKAIAGK